MTYTVVILQDGETEKADLRPIADVDMPEGAEIFCVPVHDGWGM